MAKLTMDVGSPLIHVDKETVQRAPYIVLDPCEQKRKSEMVTLNDMFSSSARVLYS